MSRFRRIRGHIVDSLPDKLRKRIIYRYRYKVPHYQKLHKKRIELIKKRGTANVLFVVSSLSIWKYDQIFQILINDKRFNVSVITYPFNSYSDEARRTSIDQLQEYFRKFPVALYNAYQDGFDIQGCLDSIDADIVFYPMPYEGIYGNALEYSNYLDRLICYVQYGIGTAKGGLYTNTPFHNQIWRIYVATALHKKIAENGSYNHGENATVTGEANTIHFRNAKAKYSWKHDGEGVKKLIWAPHYSIAEGQAFHRVSFTWLSEFMLNLPNHYNGKLQLVFKPHPKLKTMLYENSDWGKERTDKYYEQWEIGENSSIEEGYYGDLFATCDGMIHDSCSFIGEFMYTEKPVLFTSRDIDSVRNNEMNEFGNACLDGHYHTSTTDGVTKFVDDVIFGGNDPLKEKREQFYNNVLTINDNLTTGERIYNNIKKSLKW